MKVALILLCLVHVATNIPASIAQENDRSPDRRRLPSIFRNVDLSEAQLKQIETISKEFRDKFGEIIKRQNAIYTPEQQQTRRNIVRKSRDSFDSAEQFEQAKKAIADAVNLSPEQKKQLGALAQERGKIQKSLLEAYFNILTPEQQRANGRRKQQANRRQRIAPTYANVSYGPHQRNVMDVWIAKSDKPTPVFFSIHGGGFRGGNKGVDGGLLKACLNNGISVVAITYRLSQDAIAPASFHDSARAVQFVRSKAQEWNLDKTRVASSGGSAGAGISLWLAFHDDLEDQNNSDPVQRESTRLKCAVVFNGQTTYDPREIHKLIPEADTFRHGALALLYDVDLSKGLENIAPEKLELFEECSPITHFNKTDPPVLLAYATDLDTKITSQGIGIHHPRFGELLKKKMDDLSVECIVSTRSKRGSQEWIDETMDFLKKHLVPQE